MGYPLGYSDLERFGKIVKLVGFKPFTSAANALENINAVSEGSYMRTCRMPIYISRFNVFAMFQLRSPFI